MIFQGSRCGHYFEGKEKKKAGQGDHTKTGNVLFAPSLFLKGWEWSTVEGGWISWGHLHVSLDLWLASVDSQTKSPKSYNGWRQWEKERPHKILLIVRGGKKGRKCRYWSILLPFIISRMHLVFLNSRLSSRLTLSREINLCYRVEKGDDGKREERTHSSLRQASTTTGRGGSSIEESCCLSLFLWLPWLCPTWQSSATRSCLTVYAFTFGCLVSLSFLTDLLCLPLPLPWEASKDNNILHVNDCQGKLILYISYIFEK